MAHGTQSVTEMALAQASSGMRELYVRAFAEFGASALWNLQQLAEPVPVDILAVARQLRIEGDLTARRLAEEMEQLARADL